MVFVVYEILNPAIDLHARAPPTTGALEIEPQEGTKLRLRDVLEQWPFSGEFYWRVLFTPPNEPYVYLDVPDATTALPVHSDGSVQLRVLPLEYLKSVRSGDAPGETWSWNEDDLAAWNAKRIERSTLPQSATSVKIETKGVSPGERSSHDAVESGELWEGTDGGFKEGGPGVGGGGSSKGSLAEKAEEGAAALAAAGEAAAAATAAAMKNAGKILQGWGASLMSGLKGTGVQPKQ